MTGDSISTYRRIVSLMCRFMTLSTLNSHASHHLLAIYALGANKELLEAAYATHVAYMKPAISPPGEQKVDTIINDSNWKDFVDDEQ